MKWLLLELQTKVGEDLAITEKATTRTFTFKTLCEAGDGKKDMNWDACKKIIMDRCL